MGGIVAAIILSAGYSSRMGEFKPLLPLGDATVLEQVIALFRSAGVEDIRVVIGHRSTELLPLLRTLAVRWVVNERYAEGMFSSVQAGIVSLEDDIGAFFLLPVDIPLVRKETVTTLLREHEQDNSHILYPSFCGEKGHPPLIPHCYKEGILTWSGDGGLKSFLARYEAEAVHVEVSDEFILADMDRPEDYQRIAGMWQRRDIPSARECQVILSAAARHDEDLLRHCREVARLCQFLTGKLNEKGCCLDTGLIIAAALLHDLARGEKDHAVVGACLLREMGYSRVADIVVCHMNISIAESEPICEKEVLYLADKMIRGERLVSLETRFRSRLDAHAGNTAVLGAINERLRNAREIKRRLENRLGQTLEEVLRDYQSNRDNG